MMKSKNYSIMIIPDDEKNSWSFNASRVVIKCVGFLITVLVLGCIIVLYTYIPKIEYHRNIEKNYNNIISERLEILELSNNLKKIKQMNEMVRHSLGAKLEIDEEISIVDSTLGLYEMPEKRISQLQNIPSHPPIEGFISQDLSDTGHFLKETHYGIDIVAKDGDPIMAAASGVVVFSGWTYDYGNMIIIYHGDDYFTHYGHNKKNLKKQLDIVNRGDIIGLVGSTGISSGPHLHFEIWREFKPVDPLLYFPEYSHSSLTYDYNE